MQNVAAAATDRIRSTSYAAVHAPVMISSTHLTCSTIVYRSVSFCTGGPFTCTAPGRHGRARDQQRQRNNTIGQDAQLVSLHG